MTNMVELQEVVDINPRIPKSLLATPERKVSFLPMAAVSEEGVVLRAEERALKDVVKGYTYFQRGDVLLAKITPCFENGKAAVVDDLPHSIGFGSTEFHVLRPENDINSKYLFHLIWNPRFRFIGERNMTGTAGQKRVPVDFLKRYEIPLPPLPEQKRISAILDKADAIRRKRQQAIQLADDLLRSVFLDMFGDPVTNSKTWISLPIKDLGTVVTGTTPPSKKSGMFGGEIPFVTPGDLENGGGIQRFVTEQGAKYSRVVRKGATFVCCIGATIGKVGIAETRSAFNQQINAVEWGDTIDDMFGYWAMRFLKYLVIKRAITTTLPILKKSGFELIPMPVPPSALQQRFRGVVDKCCEIMIEFRSSYDHAGCLLNSLTQRAFRGEL